MVNKDEYKTRFKTF